MIQRRARAFARERARSRSRSRSLWRFARVNMIRVEGERLYRLSLELSDVRRAVIERVRTAADLDRAFRDLATSEPVN